MATALPATAFSGRRVKQRYESGSQPFAPQSRFTRSPSPPAPVRIDPGSPFVRVAQPGSAARARLTASRSPHTTDV